MCVPVLLRVDDNFALAADANDFRPSPDMSEAGVASTPSQAPAESTSTSIALLSERQVSLHMHPIAG